MVKITRLPPGEALGARDLQGWATSRFKARSTFFTSDKKYKMWCLNCAKINYFKTGAKRKCSKCGSNKLDPYT